MVTVDLILVEIEFGLHLIENNANLTFIFFLALSLLAILGLRFTYYAHRNMVQTELDVQMPIWLYLRYIGALATIYSLLGLLEIVSSLQFNWKDGLILGMALLLAFALRQIHFTASTGDNLISQSFEQITRAIFVAAVFIYVAVVVITGPTAVTATLLGASALGFALYGGAYFQDQTASSRLQGTMLDSLLRHLLPVLTFASLAGIIALAIPLGVPRVVVLHVQVVFVIMTATALMTATIKLRQNLAGL